MNVATGTFGTGIPKDCPDCKRELDYEFVSDGWNAKSMTKTFQERFEEITKNRTKMWNEMKKPEAKWQILWNQYLREKRKKGEMYGFYELKQTTKTSFPFSKIEIHQYDGLQATEKEGLVWKLSDEDRRQKPCDTICIPPLPSYIVIKFPDGYYVIRIGEIVKMREEGGISITQEMAKDKAERIIVLGNLTPTEVL